MDLGMQDIIGGRDFQLCAGHTKDQISGTAMTPVNCEDNWKFNGLMDLVFAIYRNF
jgi:hypothetical protein